MFRGILIQQDVVMVLQLHNSKLTIELLQDFKLFQTINQISTRLKLELIQSLSELDKFQVQISKERRATLSTPTTLLDTRQDCISNEQVGG